MTENETMYMRLFKLYFGTGNEDTQPMPAQTQNGKNESGGY